MAQCDRIVHRGPDDAGTWCDGDFGFGMRRLSIVDIAGGHQPMASDDGRFDRHFNGEIFNHPSCAASSRDAGSSFPHEQRHRDASCAASCTGATDAWPRLEGMFAVALWDRAAHAARSRATRSASSRCTYAAERTASRSPPRSARSKLLPELRFDIDERAVHDFFSFGHVQTPRSIYRQVESLEPGHVLRLGPTGAATRRVFWQPRFRDPGRGGGRRTGSRRRANASCRRSSSTCWPMCRSARFFGGGRLGRGHGSDDARHEPSHQGIHHRLSALHDRRNGGGAAHCGAPRLRARRLADAADGARGDLSRRATLLRRAVRGDRGSADLVPVAPGGAARKGGAVRRGRRRALRRLQAAAHRAADAALAAADPGAGPRREASRSAAAIVVQELELSSAERDALPRRGAPRQRLSALLRGDADQLACAACTHLHSRVLAPARWPRWICEARSRNISRARARALAPPATVPARRSHRAHARLALDRLDRASMAHSLEARVPFLSHRFVDWSLTIPLRPEAQRQDRPVRVAQGGRAVASPRERSTGAGKLRFQFRSRNSSRRLQRLRARRLAFEADGIRQATSEAPEVNAIPREHPCRARPTTARNPLRHHDVQFARRQTRKLRRDQAAAAA